MKHAAHSDWSGYVVPQSDYDKDSITATESTWVQPAVKETPGAPTSTDYHAAPDASFWTGTGTSNVIQAGCDSIATETPQYRCWTEDYPEGTHWEGPTISPGDSIYVNVNYIGANIADYFIEDETTGVASAFANPVPDVGLDSADFAAEAPGIATGFYLPNYGTVPVSGNVFTVESNALSYTDYQLSSGNGTADEIYDEDSGDILSAPTPVASDGSFSQVYQAPS